MSGSDARRAFTGLLLLVVVVLPLASAAGLKNQLEGHASPYLALHAHDPVAWQTWDANTIARARRENKLLFVSVGYFACHWCHVMQRESYQNAQIASQLNRTFIPVKVDRELNGGLDAALQSFSERLMGGAGWPLNALVTPEGYPVYVLLYARPDELSAVLQRVSARWSEAPAEVRRLAAAAAPPPPPEPARVALSGARMDRLWNAFLQAVWQEADPLHGGFGSVAKFPMVPQFDALLERQVLKPDARRAEFLRLSLDQMAARGLRDHVGGGFFRYTVDPGWETPHFEKMLSDNALLAMLYLRAAQDLGEPRYAAVADDALDFMLAHLQRANGGLASSTSAVDAQGREGGAYLWEPDELQRLLSPQSYAAVARVWRLDTPRVLGGGYLPAELRTPTAEERPLLDGALRTLRRARKAAVPVDEKQVAGLNGLALSALSRASSHDPRYRAAAGRVQRFVLTQLVDRGSLLKAVARGQRLRGAELEDYAYVAQGLLDYADATGDPESREPAVRLLRTAWATYWTPRGWKNEARPLLAIVQPDAVVADGALYSPSEVLMLATLRVQASLREPRVHRTAEWNPASVARDPFSYPTRVRLLTQVAPAPE